MPKPYCRLCDALAGRLTNGDVRRCDTVLYRTPHFVLVPSIAPLVDGHAMIVSRKHFISLAAMSDEALADYTALTEMLLRLRAVSGDLLEAEHGGTTENFGAGCVAHTHVNVLPGMGELAALFMAALEPLSAFNKIPQIKTVTDPYIMIRPNGGSFTMFSASRLPSQFIRRVLAAHLGVADWNWRTAQVPDGVERTIAFWKSGLTDASTS